MTTDVLPADEWQAEVDQLREDEAIIEAGLATFVDVGQALARIRDGRRYRLEGFDTFEDYCRERWNLARRTAYQLIEGAETVCAMAHITATPITSERQARELAAIVKSDGPERAAEVLEQVAAEGKVTAKAIVVGKRVESQDGRIGWQQAILSTFTWDEVIAWIRDIQSQIDGLAANLTIGAAVLRLREQYPDSKGPGDACEKAGTTIEAYLAEAGAA